MIERVVAPVRVAIRDLALFVVHDELGARVSRDLARTMDGVLFRFAMHRRPITTRAFRIPSAGRGRGEEEETSWP